MSASFMATKYGNLNFVPKNTLNSESTSVVVESVVQGVNSFHSGSEMSSSQSVSRQELVVIGVSLDHLSPSVQLAVCCGGVFVFYLIYGYVQVGVDC